MSWHLFGNILTHEAPAANNRGENEGNITTLQKLLWKGEIHTTVSAEAIRYALRLQWQNVGLDVNRKWNDEKNDNEQLDEHYQNWQQYIDDDVLGFMRADAAKEESTETEEGGKKRRAKGTNKVRRGVLEVTRAISTLPFSGDITFNAKSGEKGRTSLYGTEVHATRYQFGFAMTPERLSDQQRVFHVMDALVSLRGVGGNQSRFFYDFSPESIILRWTHDPAPRILYSFEEKSSIPGYISIQSLIETIEAGDLAPSELYVGGAIIRNQEQAEKLKNLGVNVNAGIIQTAALLKDKMAQSLQTAAPASLIGVS